jgi:1-acyl-sn-glycerol-3-phosphate acyltransferase
MFILLTENEKRKTKNGKNGRQLAWGLWFLFWLVLLTLILATAAIISTFIDRRGNLSQLMARCWGRTLLFIAGVKTQVLGLEHLQPGRTYVFAANHRSNFDIYVLYSTLPGRFLWVAKESLFRIPVFGQALSRMGCVPVDRTNRQAAIRSLNHAASLVAGGTSMIIFPEGTRGTTPELLPFKKGVFVMALKAGQPIVPVSISGTFFIQPRGVIRVRPGPVRVVISPPIHPQDFPPNRKGELMEAVRQALAAGYDPCFPESPGGAHG